MITILNTSIITSPGRYDLIPVTLEQATEAVKALGHQSAVGHESTSKILSDLLGVAVPVNRQEYRQEPGGLALVFKSRGRPPEGAILSRGELEKIGFDFFFLRRDPRVQEMEIAVLSHEVADLWN